MADRLISNVMDFCIARCNTTLKNFIVISQSGFISSQWLQLAWLCIYRLPLRMSCLYELGPLRIAWYEFSPKRMSNVCMFLFASLMMLMSCSLSQVHWWCPVRLSQVHWGCPVCMRYWSIEDSLVWVLFKDDVQCLFAPLKISVHMSLLHCG